MSTVIKDLGAVSAYAYAVEKGYTGTEAEFAELMADYAEVGQRAENAAESALNSKTAAQTAATTAITKASEATTAATTATNKAAEAQADADAAALDASQAMSAASTATTKATEATTAAATATSAATTATTAKDDAVSAKTAAQTAQTGAETAAASVQSSAAQIATNTSDITELKEDLTNITNVIIGNNLLDKSVAVTGALANRSGYIDTNGSYASYLTSDYIPVEYGKTYTIYLASGTGLSINKTRIIYVLFDSEKAGQSIVNQTGTSSLTVTPLADGYIRVSVVNTEQYPYFNNYLMVIEGSTYIGYEAYNKTKYLSDSISPINTILDKVLDNTNVLRGKKWAHCGDSFSDYTDAEFDSGDFSGQDKTFPRIIANRNSMSLLQDFMMSGRTLAYPSDETFTNSLTCSSISGYYQNIPSDVNYVTIMLGINDCQHTGSGTTGDGEDATGEITLGTIDDATTATYYGAWNVVLGWLRENRPFAHVGIIVTNGTERQDYTEAQIAIAKKWGYPYINLNGDDKTPAMLRCYNTNISTTLKNLLKKKQAVDYDGTETGTVNLHPNYSAHDYESTFIEEFLRSI